MRDRIVQHAAASARPAKDGADGLNAFDLAKRAGFRGTFDQWLASLKGETGPRGQTGERGAPGTDGRDATMISSNVEFERDPETQLTRRVMTFSDDGQLLFTITPIRDAQDYMAGARIEVGG